MTKVKDVITREVKITDPDSTLKDAADKMKEFDVGVLPVVNDGDVVGLLTDRDIVVRAIADGKDPNNAKVSDAMTAGVTSCREDDDIEKAAALMKEKQVRRLVVLDSNEKLAGVCSIGDLATLPGTENEFAGSVLEQVSKPSS
jgi:CBS domain-containing protein